MAFEARNGEPQFVSAGIPDSLGAAIEELRRHPRSQWLDLARRDQSARWRRRAGVQSEHYLSLLPELLAEEEEALVLICGEIHLRREAGELPSLAEYQRRFPHLAAAIALQFDMDRVFDDDAPAAESDEEVREFDLPGYEFLERIGSGSSGAVYQALQKSLNRIVAVKVCSVRGADAKALARLDQEAEILARLHHPHVVQIYEVVRTADELYLVMEFVDGPNLQEYVDGRPLPPREAARRALMLAKAIETIHESGILHRDLKPSNVLVPGDDQLKVTDFGLAKLRTSDNMLTTADSVLGTPSYMAPEQATGAAHAAGPEADVYSLGAILYELLTGRPPFLGATVLDTLSLIRQLDPAPPRRLQPAVPLDLETIALKCLEKEPQRRYPTAAALAADLDRFMGGIPILARRPSYPERLWRWSKRNPIVSALSGGLAVAVIAGFAGVAWQLQVAESLRQAESKARQEADKRIVQLQEAVELVDRSRNFRDLQQFNDARECLDEALRLRPEYRNAWEARAFLQGHFCLFDLAAADRREAMKLAEPTDSFEWWDYATLLAYDGERERVAAWSVRMQERFRGVTGVKLLELARTTCLVDSAAADYHRLAEIVRQVTPDDTEFPLNAYVLGLIYYRLGRYEEAAEWCAKSVELSQQPQNPWCYGLNAPVLALAHHRLGATRNAQLALDDAERWESLWVQQLYDSGTPRGVHHQGSFAWPLAAADWLEFQVLLREARQQLCVPSPPDDPRWRAIRARSFAALHRFDDAVREYQEAVTRSPTDSQLRMELHRGLAFAALGRADYAQAATEFGNAWQLMPDDALPCQYHAQAYLYAGNQIAYRQVCAEMLRQFATTQDPVTAARVVFTCTQQRDSVSNMNELLPLSKLAARAWGEPLQGMACVRTGQYADALRYYELVELRHTPRPRDLCFKAIAYYHLGQTEQLERCLADVREWMRRADLERLPVIDRSIPAWGDWYERSEAHALLAEAEALIATGSRSP